MTRPNTPSSTDEHAATLLEISPPLEVQTSPPTLHESDSAEVQGQGSSGPARVQSNLARYELGSKLGVGGMGEVLIATDKWIGRDVAWKRMRNGVSTSDQARRRFLREIRIQGQLEHPAIVPVYDLAWDQNGNAEFTMRRVRGTTLEEVLEATNPSVEPRGSSQRYTRTRLLNAFVSVCMAIHYAHTRGVVHRDLKPGNVMLGEFGEVYVLDWGIAKVLSDCVDPVRVEPSAKSAEGETLELTGMGQIMGTPAYMAPEQLRGEIDRITPATDVYSLGAILYEMLVRRPLHTGNLVSIITRITEGFDVRPSSVSSDVPQDLDEICVRALATDPAKRFASARELAEAIEEHLEGDRDTERRREMARTYARSALDRTRAALEDNASPEHMQAERTRAMSDAVRALALDSQQPLAQRAVVELVSRIPKRLPTHAESKYAELMDATRRKGGRTALVGYGSWLFAAPFGLISGVRGWVVPVVMSLLIFVLMGAGYKLERTQQSTRSLFAWAIAIASSGAIALCSSWLGPFVLGPMMVVTNSVMLAFGATPKERVWVITLGVVALLVPFVAEALHWVPSSYEFRDGGIMLLPRALNISRNATTLTILYTCVSFAILPAWFAGNMRDQLREAERKLFLQAWNLESLFRPTTAESTAG